MIISFKNMLLQHINLVYKYAKIEYLGRDLGLYFRRNFKRIRAAF